MDKGARFVATTIAVPAMEPAAQPPAAPSHMVMLPKPTSQARSCSGFGGLTVATNDPNSAGCKRHDGQTSHSGCAR